MLHQFTFAPNWPGWQRAARRALKAEWPPHEILWQELSSDQPLLEIASETEEAAPPASRVMVPRNFIETASRVACHADPERWGLLYRILWRLTHGEPRLLQIVVDPDVHKLEQMDKAIRREVHKMRAFVRFRAVPHEGATWYVAWFEPAHHIMELNAPFFVDRFANMCWSILTPDVCAHWDQSQLSFTEGVTRAGAPAEDTTEVLWLRYYSHIFNPARVKVPAMQKEMPKKYWKNLPEAAVIPALLNDSPKRVNLMMAKSRSKLGATGFHAALVPETKDAASQKPPQPTDHEIQKSPLGETSAEAPEA
jgi:DNA polymerase